MSTTCEQVFVTAQGSPLARFRRAIEHGSLMHAKRDRLSERVSAVTVYGRRALFVFEIRRPNNARPPYLVEFVQSRTNRRR